MHGNNCYEPFSDCHQPALTAALVLLLARERVVHAELVGVLLRNGLDLIVVQLCVAVGGAHEQPRQTREPV